jgi:Arc/MetJ-type ribon-helix-helix transcriptional regulator
MARMTRTIISLPEDDKKWLDGYAGRQRISSAEVIRRAISEYRTKRSQKDLGAVLRETAGSWSSVSGDSREYIDALRREWERKP